MVNCSVILALYLYYIVLLFIKFFVFGRNCTFIGTYFFRGAVAGAGPPVRAAGAIPEGERTKKQGRDRI